MARRDRSQDSGLRRIWGILLLPVCVSVLLSLLSYDWRDIGLLHTPPNSPPSNVIGPVGAWLGFALFTLFGAGAYAVPLWCLLFGLVLLFDNEPRVWPRGVWSAVVLLCPVLLLSLGPDFFASTCDRLNVTHPGGLVGRLVMDGLIVRLLSVVGGTILVLCALAVALVFLVDVQHLAGVGVRLATGTAAGVRGLATGGAAWVKAAVEKRRARAGARATSRAPRPPRSVLGTPSPVEAAAPPAASEDAPVQAGEDGAAQAPVERKRPRRKPRSTPAGPEGPAPPEASPPEAAEEAPAGPREYRLPPFSALGEGDGGEAVVGDTAKISAVLVDTLRQFGIEVKVTHVEKGPVVTRYELLPAPGVRVEKITALRNNIAMGLRAGHIRVQAPVPGKGVIGVEVPNTRAKMVSLRDVLSTSDVSWERVKVPIVLGKDVGGSNLVADLADMPHLLVAGATGSGKTVCTNTILSGLLMTRTPDQLKLMLIDPKRVEFSGYNHLPHLVVPVITEPSKVPIGLRWALNEMDKRYKLFAHVGVRNISAYNSREVMKQTDLFADETGAGDEAVPDRLSYIVIIVDELSDLMMSKAQADIEDSIARLAQLSRAVGIHMILSTQRPSVDVITGTIKANFPARIAFQVAQKTDSRTILDNVGAEGLLGRGDMLFLPPGSSRLMRAQGALTTDDEIRRIVSFIREQAEPEYEEDIRKKLEKKTSGRSGALEEEGEDEDPELLERAVEIIRQSRRASTSSLQRRLRIGYTRAARVMDVLEERGVIGPPRGSEPREILIDLDGEIPENPPEQTAEDEGEADAERVD